MSLVSGEVNFSRTFAGDHPNQGVKVRHSPVASENLTNKVWPARQKVASHFQGCCLCCRSLRVLNEFVLALTVNSHSPIQCSSSFRSQRNFIHSHPNQTFESNFRFLPSKFSYLVICNSNDGHDM